VITTFPSFFYQNPRNGKERIFDSRTNEFLTAERTKYKFWTNLNVEIDGNCQDSCIPISYEIIVNVVVALLEYENWKYLVGNLHSKVHSFVVESYQSLDYYSTDCLRIC